MTERDQAEGRIRPCDQADADNMLAVINAAAKAYRGVIPADHWHDPYMPADEWVAEIADAVTFSGYDPIVHWLRTARSSAAVEPAGSAFYGPTPSAPMEMPECR